MSYYHPSPEGAEVTIMAVLPVDVRYVRRTERLAATEMRVVSYEAFDALRAEVERLRERDQNWQRKLELIAALVGRLNGEEQPSPSVKALREIQQMDHEAAHTGPSPGDGNG